MSAPLTPDREQEIRAALAAIPAPPWRWIGLRGSGGPQLVTDHSGRQYLLRAAKPTDHRGDELLDPETDAVVYGNLEFRDQREGEGWSSMRSGNGLAVGRTEYDPDAIVGVANPLARWFEKSAQHATDLLAEVDRLRAERAQLQDDITGACLARYEEEQENARLRARVAELEAGSPWERAVAGLNALVDADVAFHVEPDGHISAPFSDEHIEWDLKAKRWVLSRDEDDDSYEAAVARYLATPYTDDGPRPLRPSTAPVSPFRPCGCPKRFDRHADGCAYSECPSCGAPADVTGQRIPEHRTGCPQGVSL